MYTKQRCIDNVKKSEPVMVHDDNLDFVEISPERNLDTQYKNKSKDGDYTDLHRFSDTDGCDSSDDDLDLGESNEKRMMAMINRVMNDLGPAPAGHEICVYLGGTGQAFEDRLCQKTAVNRSELFGVVGRPLGIVGKCRAGRLLVRGLNRANCKQANLSGIEGEWVRGGLWIAGQGREIVNYNFAEGGGGGYAGLEDQCQINGFSLYLIAWHEYTGGMPANEYMRNRRQGWNLNSKGFGPSEQFLLKYLGLEGGMGGDTQLICNEEHPIPYYRECIDLRPLQERRADRQRRQRGEEPEYHPGRQYHASYAEEQRCKTLLCRQCNQRYNVESLTIDAIILPGNKMWTRQTGRVELHPEWEIDSI